MAFTSLPILEEEVPGVPLIFVLIYELLNLFFSSVADPSTNDFYCIVFHLYFISIFQRTRCDNN